MPHSRKSILVISDDAGMLDIISIVFSEAGYETAAAANGAAGLDAAKGDFDLVFLDISLPEINSMEVLKTIRQDKPDLPVIMITAYGSTQAAVEAFKLGAYNYITRPFDMDEILIVTERALEQKLAKDENRFLRSELEKAIERNETIPVTAALRDVEKIHIERVLKHKKWNQSAAAHILGVDRKTLRNKIREFKLKKDGEV